MNTIEKMKDTRKAAFLKLGEFLKENGFEVKRPEQLTSGGLLYGYICAYSGELGIMYDERVFVVSLDVVYLVGKRRPLNYTKFEPIETYSYSSKDELLAILEELLLGYKNVKGVW